MIKLSDDFKDTSNIDSICKEFGIKNYTINSDGSIDVDGDVRLENEGLTKLPLKFGEVTGDFSCHGNKLITLEGAPQSLVRSFYCHSNQLTSLEGGPREVGAYFDCGDNQLTSLEGAPLSVGGYFYCRDNPVEKVWDLFSDYSLHFVSLYAKMEIFNYYDPIRDDMVIILDRLNSFLLAIGKEPVTEVSGYKCI